MDESSTTWLLFRKIKRGFDQQCAEVARGSHEREGIEQELDEVRLKKRKKVRQNPNEKFALIEAIKRAQNQLNGVVVEDAVPGGAIELEEEDDARDAAFQPNEEAENIDTRMLAFLDDMGTQQGFF